MKRTSLGLGRIVGNPTDASVIATGSYGLINLESYGVAPDVFVKNSPRDGLDGFDRELDAAIRKVLRMLSEGVWQYRR